MKKFLYKIHSNYDGFYPKRIPARIIGENSLKLNWQRYIDVVDIGDEVWVYFHGSHKFENGVYVEGFVQAIDTTTYEVDIRIRQFSEDTPLTDAETTEKIAEVVAPRYRQVFLYPQEWAVAPTCTVQLEPAESCSNRLCGDCATWEGLSQIQHNSYSNPARLPLNLSGFIPAFWIRPNRCYLHGRVSRAVRRTSDLFYRFKTGDASLAFPFALGIFESLRRQRRMDFECIVPIPLSPDKVEKKEINRTRLLADELGKLLGIKVVDGLSLNTAISKRRMLSWGYTRSDFEYAYYRALSASDELADYDRMLLLDDVCTEGTTLRCATRRIKEVNPECELFAVTAGQMIVKRVVINEALLTD